MKIDYQRAYLHFCEYLNANHQRYLGQDIDIREKILSLRNARVTISYIEGTLAHGNGANLRRLFPQARGIDAKDWLSSDVFFSTGTIFRTEEHTHKAAVRLFEQDIFDKEIYLFELGFLATTHSWAHGFKKPDPKLACLGFVYDDISHYFMADYPGRLIQRLNSALELTSEERRRAQALIQRIVDRGISKYNAQPFVAPTLSGVARRRVLVCDQTYADASTVYGRIDEVGFDRMLLAAIRENPDAEILVKSHPDTSWSSKTRTGYFSRLQEMHPVRVLREPVNPYVLFEFVDTVYVGSSQMGLEALFAGKRVVCFGAPFYAGWGLTDDRVPIPHRRRQRTLEDVFHAFYIWYTIYHVPGAAT